MRGVIYVVIMFVSFAAITLSCSKNNGDTPVGPDGSSGNCSGAAGPLFTAVKSVLVMHCAVSGCHAGSMPEAGINLFNNCTIVSQKARIRFRSIDQANTPSQMPVPPRAPLNAEERAAIRNWIAAGGRVTD